MPPAKATSCPRCGHSNPSGIFQCQKCSASLSSSDDMETVADTGWSLTAEGGSAAPIQINPGAILGQRYEILSVLGHGGMGTVYKAHDRELDRVVGLKVIRPDLANNVKALRRFKQELILARQVTHKNVVRIYDLGSADGVKFITMEFLEGRDLSAILEETPRLPIVESTRIMRQVCRALDAAHAENVVHRDLKPQNIMVSSDGRVWVMDFGLARSAEMHGLTQTGSIMGTPAYMSPEQAMGINVDCRSDLFSFGIIFYSMLTGVVPFEAETMMGSLLKRTRETAQPPREINPEIPQELNDLILKCLALKPEDRYQNAGEMLPTLDLIAGDTVQREWTAPADAKRLRSWQRLSAGMAALLVVVLGLGFFFRNRGTKPVAPTKPLGVIIADFDNRTGDPLFSGTLEPTFGLALEGASFIASYPRSNAMRAANQIKPGATQINPELARLIATREGIGIVIEGAIKKSGDSYTLSARAIDTANEKVLGSDERSAGDKGAVLTATSKLAAALRAKLGDATPESVQLRAAESFTAASLEAAHSYAAAQDLRYSGKSAAAIEQYLKAVEQDPNLGSAYASLALTYVALGQRDKGEEYYERAMAKIDRMSEREKYRTRGAYYLMVKNPDKAIGEFTALLKQYPADSAGLNNLAYAYQQLRDMPRAVAEQRRGLEIYPKSLIARNNVAHYAMYAGEFDTAEQEARAVIEGGYIKAYLALALSQLAKGKPQDSIETYGRLEKVSAQGASLAAGGLADLALYEGRTADAIAILEKSMVSDLAAKDNSAAARKAIVIALAHLTAGRKPAAIAAADRAAGLSKDTSILCLAGMVDVEAGQEAKAHAIAADFDKHLEPEPRAYGKLIEAAILVQHGKSPDAVKILEDASKLTDSWLGRLVLGRAYLQAGAFAEADAEFDHCLKRRGEATEMFLDELATYHFLPPVYYYLGRAQEGLKSTGAKDSYRTYLSIKQKADIDPLVQDARKRESQ